MRVLGIVLMVVLLVLLGAQIYSSLVTQNELRKELTELQEEFQKAQLSQTQLQEDYEFYSIPENLEKELRARFNYRAVGEKMIIIVPETATSSPNESP